MGIETESRAVHAWKDSESKKYICIRVWPHLWLSKSFYDRLTTKRGDLGDCDHDKQKSRKMKRFVACQQLLSILDDAANRTVEELNLTDCVQRQLRTYASKCSEKLTEQFQSMNAEEFEEMQKTSG